MKHDPPAIWAQLEPVLQFLKNWFHHPKIQKLFFISDGPTMQYRRKKNFYLLSTIPFQMGSTAVNWSFLEAGHGKGPADGVGATMKRTADSQVARGTDIPRDGYRNPVPLWHRFPYNRYLPYRIKTHIAVLQFGATLKYNVLGLHGIPVLEKYRGTIPHLFSIGTLEMT